MNRADLGGHFLFSYTEHRSVADPEESAQLRIIQMNHEGISQNRQRTGRAVHAGSEI
jgi:hypothetical protein